MSFADSFWTQDYNSGFRIFFEQLYQGISENEEYIQLFSKRMESEIFYGNSLKSIEDTLIHNNKRLRNEDYISSTKNAFKQLNENFSSQGEYHLQIGENIRRSIIEPFSSWCHEHKQRIKYSESIINEKFKSFQSNKTALEKLQKKYFNKCRLLEEFKSHYADDEINIEAMENEEQAELHNQTFKINSKSYDYQSIKSLLTKILSSIELTSYKVPILGTYNNCSTGSSIAQWLLDNLPELNNNIISAEDFAQDLINNNFIKVLGTMSNKTFINSSKYYYQWKPVVFEITQLNYELNFNISDYFEDMKQVIGVNSIDFNDKSQLNKLIQEINLLDNQYFSKTVELDKLRCEFEEIIFDHLTFMEKCELDRSKAIKKVIFDFLSNFLNNFKSINETLNNLLILEETINPFNDLKFLIENFQTGKFNPQVILYDNYYNSNINQNFGIDLSIKSRLDKKVVPNLIQCILLNLDKIYPNLHNDLERIDLWVKPISLSKIHELRFKLNNLNDLNKINEILLKSDPILITNLLKLYLIELPDSVISNNLFDLIKSLYQLNINDLNSRINGLKNILINLPKSNLATLDSILTHLMRLIKIISKKDINLSNDLKAQLSKEFSNLILRPKLFNENDNDNGSINYDFKLIEKLQFNLINDLFEYKDFIFDDLRRKNSKNKSIQTSEMEEKEQKSKVIDVQTNEEKNIKDARSSSRSPTRVPTSSSQSSSNSIKSPSTPPPLKSAASNSLKRSSSPNKKKLSSLLTDPSSKASPSSKFIVSSKPIKKDISYSSSSDSVNELGQPKFNSNLSRNTSVKDMASKFDSASISDKESANKSKNKDEAIVVDW